MKAKILFLFKFTLLFYLVATQAPYHFDVLDVTYTAGTNSKMNHLLYNYADASNTPYSAFYLNDDSNSSTTSYADKISGLRYEPRSQEVFIIIIYYNIFVFFRKLSIAFLQL